MAKIETTSALSPKRAGGPSTKGCGKIDGIG